MSQQKASDDQPKVSLSLVCDLKQVKQLSVIMLQKDGIPLRVMSNMPELLALFKTDLKYLFFLMFYFTRLHKLSDSAF